MLLFCILLALCGSIYCCFDLQLVHNFNFSNYARGKWYEIARHNTYKLEKDAKCITYHFHMSGNGDFVTREVFQNNITTFKAQIHETAVPGKILLHAKGSATPYSDLVVIASNNKDYAIIFSCIEEYAWILSRSPKIEPELKAEIDKYINETQVIDASKLVWDAITSKKCLDENL